jgi:hypothetical protein
MELDLIAFRTLLSCMKGLMLGKIYDWTAFRNGSIATPGVVSRQQINLTLIKTVFTAVEFVVALFQQAKLFRIHLSEADSRG